MTGPAPLRELLDDTLRELRPHCAVRDYHVRRGIVGPTSDPCPNLAAFESICRNCGRGGPTCAEHEADIQTDPVTMCGTCRAYGLGAAVYAFIPLD